MRVAAPSTAHPWHRRTDVLAVLVFAGLASFTAVLLWHATRNLSLTVAEAQALESGLAVPASVHAYLRRLFVGTPLTEMLLRLAHAHLSCLWRARALFWLLNTLNLALLILVARQGSRGRLTMWCTLVLAGISAQWWLRALQIGPMVMTTCAILLVQWTWHHTYLLPNWQHLAAYVGAGLVALTMSPYVGCLFMIHAITWVLALARKRGSINVADASPSRAVLLSLLQLTLLLVALLVTFNRTLHLTPPAWILERAWWHDVAHTLWTAVCAMSGGSYIGLPLIPTLASWKDARTAYLITWVLTALIVLACVRSRRQPVCSTSIWAITLFTLPFIWTLVTGQSPHRDGSAFRAVTWPYLILLSADAAAWLMGKLYHAVIGSARRVTQYVGIAMFIALTVFVVVTWFLLQRTACETALYDLGDQDVGAPARFLAQVCQPSDRVIFVSAKEPEHDTRFRWCLAPLRSTLHATPILTSAPAHVAAAIAHALPAHRHTGVVWVVNHACDPLTLSVFGLTNASLLFAVRLEHLCATGLATQAFLGQLYRQAASLAPYAGQLQRQLCEWYKSADESLLQTLVLCGQAQQDLAGRRPLRWHPYQRAAANAVLYAWARQYPRALSAALYPPFHEFVSAVGPRVLDRERVLFLYRQHIEQALAGTNLALANAALCAARRWDKSNPYLDRLAAQGCLLEDPTQTARARHLNARAARTYERRYGRPYVEALFANMILDKQANQTARAIASCMAILKLVQQEAFIPLAVRTNTSPEAHARREEWQRQRLFWEAQCHSYLAWLLLSTGDYQQAVAWLSRNLAPRFDEVRRLAAYEQLARLYAESGDLPRAVRHFETLAALATSTVQRIYWLVQAAQLHVSAGDTVAAHETWQQILELTQMLDNVARRALVRNKQYQRLAHYLARRMNIDSRDNVILTLQARAHDSPERAAWCYRQIAHIERARLRYDAADAFFERAMQVSPLDPDAYLDAALYFYRRLQYQRAATIFSNLLLRLNPSALETFQRSDWRYALLYHFYTQGRPTPEASALAWVAAAATNFVEPAAYANARGNILAFYDHFDEATNAFLQGIATNATWLDNYLDLGYLLATRGDSEATAAILDQLDGFADASRRLRGDWRHVTLHHVSVRPYLPDKEADED